NRCLPRVYEYGHAHRCAEATRDGAGAQYREKAPRLLRRAVGYLRGDGSMGNCIVIRSAYIKNNTAIVQAGAGVVRDSVPQSEADETLHKAYAVLHAIDAADNATLEVIR